MEWLRQREDGDIYCAVCRAILDLPKETWEEYMSREGWKYMGSASDDA
jgi:hypothetical protein